MDSPVLATRRAVLAGAGVLALAGLAACAPLSRPHAGQESASPGPSSSHGSPTPSAAPTPTPTPTVDPAAVAARYAGAAPTAFGLDLPGIRQTIAPAAALRVALTFDACGGRCGSRVDARLVDTLRREGVPATLFLNSRWIDANPALAADLAADPLFVIGNHGTRHVPLSVTGREAYGIAGTASSQEAVDEVWQNHVRLSELLGAPPRLFRPGTAFYDDIGLAIVRDLGVQPIGFAVNGDGGATFPARTVRREIGQAAGGSIVIAHMNQPGSGTAEGIEGAIADLRARGAAFVHVDG